MTDFSNRLKPPSEKDMVRIHSEVWERIRSEAHLVNLESTRYILPPDWETRLTPEMVADIKRQLGEP